MVFLKRPTYLDVAILTIFTVLITLHPYYLYGQLNLFELGIYLPGINDLLDGRIPYRDFFYLRGPFELYMPAFLMLHFGENVSVLLSYFYMGTIMTLLSCVLLGKQLFTTRLFYYLAIPVLVARTFPRVVFTYWGGMRFALGLMAVACAMQYFKNKKPLWIFVSGIIAACGFWTSLEVGGYVCLAVLVTLIFCGTFKILLKREAIKLLLLFFGGFLMISFPYSVYLHLNSALIPFVEAVLNVFYNMENTFPQVEIVPKNFIEAVFSMLNPGSKNFRHLTPAYLYVFLAIYCGNKIRKQEFCLNDMPILCLASYGFIFYIGAFRNIWSSHFEMVLQPEKILLFVLLEKIFFLLKNKRTLLLQEIKRIDGPLLKKQLRMWAINVFLGGVILSSIGYPIQRLNKRFYAFKYIRNIFVGKETDSLKPLNDIEKIKLDIDRGRGLTVPSWQAQDFIELTQFINRHTTSQDAVLMYPEGAAYSFIVDRPYVGRFPMATFSWFNDNDHRAYMASLKKTRAKYAVVPKEVPHYFEKTHFIVSANKQKYNEVMHHIEQNYELVVTTPSLNIFKRNN